MNKLNIRVVNEGLGDWFHFWVCSISYNSQIYFNSTEFLKIVRFYQMYHNYEEDKKFDINLIWKVDPDRFTL